MKSVWLVLTVVSLLVPPVFAQVKENQTNVAEDPFSWALYAYEAAADYEGEGETVGEVEIHEVEILATPIYVAKESYQAVMGLGYKRNEFIFDDERQDDVEVYAITLPLDLIVPGEAWTFWANVTPGVFSDLEDMSEEDYRVLAYGMAMYSWKPNVQLVFGAGYDRVFGEDELYPLGGFIWEIGESWELNMVLPMPRVTYAPNEKLQLFADARPVGGVWNMHDDETDTDYDFKLEGFRFGAGLEYQVARHIWFHAAAGTSTGREYEIGEGHEQTFEAEADDSYFGRIGFVVR